MIPCLSVNAGIYQYIDDKGHEWFANDVNAIPIQYRDQLNNKGFYIDGKYVNVLPEVSSANDPSINKVPALPIPVQKNLSQVEVFVTDWCPYCRRLEEFLKSKGIAYQRYNIELDKEASDKYAALGTSGVPVTRIGTKVIHGYNPDAILQTLKK